MTSTMTTVVTSSANMVGPVLTPRSRITAHARPDIPVIFDECKPLYYIFYSFNAGRIMLVLHTVSHE